MRLTRATGTGLLWLDVTDLWACCPKQLLLRKIVRIITTNELAMGLAIRAEVPAKAPTPDVMATRSPSLVEEIKYLDATSFIVR